MTGIRLWNRAEPLKSVLAWVLCGVVLVEVFLLLGGKWLLISQTKDTGNDAYYGKYISTPATRSWQVLNCIYWTGRSSQSVKLSGEYGPIPRECPFLVPAF